MLVDLEPGWIVTLNVVTIPLIHLLIAWVFTRLPRRWFKPEGWLFRERYWERGGRLYEAVLHVRGWKKWLPDGAPWLRGFAKRNLRKRDEHYLETFRAETCRGESAHLAQIPGILGVLAWNPWPWAALAIVLYALLSNLPCMIVQRHTRHRMGRVVAGRRRTSRSAVAGEPGKVADLKDVS